MTANGNEAYNVCQRVTTNNEWQSATTNNNECYNEWHRMTTTCTTNENEC